MAFNTEENRHTEYCIYNFKLILLIMTKALDWFLTEHTHKTTQALHVFVKIATSINNISE